MAQGIMYLSYTHKYLSLNPQHLCKGQTPQQHVPITPVPRGEESILTWLQAAC